MSPVFRVVCATLTFWAETWPAARTARRPVAKIVVLGCLQCMYSPRSRNEREKQVYAAERDSVRRSGRRAAAVLHHFPHVVREWKGKLQPFGDRTGCPNTA